ncbi:TPA: hypothetical protein QFL06_002635, partial [Enterococcus faecium]
NRLFLQTICENSLFFTLHPFSSCSRQKTSAKKKRLGYDIIFRVEYKKETPQRFLPHYNIIQGCIFLI